MAELMEKIGQENSDGLFTAFGRIVNTNLQLLQDSLSEAQLTDVRHAFLQCVLDSDADFTLRVECAHVLHRIGTAAEMPALRRLLQTKSDELAARDASSEQLAQAEQLIVAITDVLGDRGDYHVVDTLKRVQSLNNPKLKNRAGSALQGIERRKTEIRQ